MSEKPKPTAILRAAATCPSHSLSHVKVRDLTLVIDEPEERGGTNTGPTPTDTALGALIGCTNVIAHKCAKSLGFKIGHLDIDAKCYFNRGGVTLQEEVDVPFEKVVLAVVSTGGEVSQQQLNELSIEVEKYCPLAKLFTQAGTVIDQTWRVG